eukprot:3298833-Rhodomonas_salina.1
MAPPAPLVAVFEVNETLALVVTLLLLLIAMPPPFVFAVFEEMATFAPNVRVVLLCIAIAPPEPPDVQPVIMTSDMDKSESVSMTMQPPSSAAVEPPVTLMPWMTVLVARSVM